MLQSSSLLSRLFIHQWQSLTLQLTFSITHRPQLNFKADRIMKNYFNLRSQMSTAETLALIDRLKTVRITPSFLNDHRWVHLNVTIHKNIDKFNVESMFRILHGFTKMKCFNDVYSSMLDKLITDVEGLVPDEKAKVIYYMAKSGKSSTEKFVKVSNSLLQSLNDSKTKMTFGVQQTSTKKEKNIKNEKQQANEKQDEKQQLYDHQQSLFEDLSKPETTNQSSFTIDCRCLVLCLWSLQKMRIKDKLLSDCMLQKFIRPNINKIPTSVMPLLMSTLWLNSLENKRVSIEVIEDLRGRPEKQFIALDREKLLMLVCMLCKPQLLKNHKPKNQKEQKDEKKEDTKSDRLIQIHKMRHELVLFLMETILIRHTSKQQILYSRTAYRILSNASDAGVVDFLIYQKYLSIICNNLREIQNRQYIYLLEIIRKLRKFSRGLKYGQSQSKEKQSANNICEEEYQKLCTELKKNIHGFLNKAEEDHPARKVLRKLVLSNFITLSTSLNKKLALQQREISKNVLKKAEDSENKKEPTQSSNSSKTENKTSSPIKKSNRNIRPQKKQKKQMPSEGQQTQS